MRGRIEALRKAARPVLAVLCALLVLVSGVRYVHRPFAAARADLLQRLEERRREVAALRAEYAQSGQLQARLRELEARVQAIERGLEEGRRQPSLLRYVEQRAQEAGVVVTALEFGEPQPVEQTPYARYPVTLRALGPYPGMVEFVGSVERVFPYVRVETLELGAVSPAREAAARPGDAGAGAAGEAGAQPVMLPDGWVNATLVLSVLARPDGTTPWDDEMRRWAAGPGRLNPFARPLPRGD